MVLALQEKIRRLRVLGRLRELRVTLGRLCQRATMEWLKLGAVRSWNRNGQACSRGCGGSMLRGGACTGQDDLEQEFVDAIWDAIQPGPVASQGLYVCRLVSVLSVASWLFIGPGQAPLHVRPEPVVVEDVGRTGAGTASRVVCKFGIFRVVCRFLCGWLRACFVCGAGHGSS